jgi:hypothetical protein
MDDFPKAIWKTYGYWVFLISLAFFPTYPFCNWFTSHRTDTLGLYLEAELNIPFIPELIWVYLSMYLLFFAPPFFLDVRQLRGLGKRLLVGCLFSSLTFLLLPSHLGFTRAIPDDPFYRSVFSGLFVVDQPHNMVPSLHVVFSSLIVLSCVEASSRLAVKTLWLLWLTCIIVSTLLVHQHHLIDCITGLAVALVLHRWIGTSSPGLLRTRR